jgi:hypothetical protein
MRKVLLFAAIGISALDCSTGTPQQTTPPEKTAVARAAIGEAQNGFPSPWERAEFMAANRARSDPATVKGPQSMVYPAQKPLVLGYDLERSARFHATTLEYGGAPLMHPSPCTLNTDVGTSGCDGKPACACTTGMTCNDCNNCAAGTDPFTRIGYFYPPGGTGEVAAAGYGDPWGVMDGWVDEAAGNDGHRTIVDGDAYTLAGFGAAGGVQGACWPTFDVGDFSTATSEPPKIASAAPKPYTGPSGTFRIYATWNDPAAGAPKDLSAVVDGHCAALTLELGDPKLNATYYADVPLNDGCHTVWILAHDSGSTRVTYPTTTAFTITVGNGNCMDEEPQPTADCEGTVGGMDAGMSGGGDAGAKPDGSAMMGGGDGGGTTGGGPDGGNGGGTPNNNPGDTNGSTSTSSGCNLGAVESTPVSAFSAIGLALAALGWSRRRRQCASEQQRKPVWKSL